MGDDQHEGIFCQLTVAFIQRDPAAFQRWVREDVVLTMAGSSPLAGEHHGLGEAARAVLRLGRFLSCEPVPIRFSHEVDRMTAHRDVVLIGRLHRVGITLHVSLAFDWTDKVRAVSILPSDPGLFDHVVSVGMEETEATPLRIPDATEAGRRSAPAEPGPAQAVRGRRLF